MVSIELETQLNMNISCLWPIWRSLDSWCGPNFIIKDLPSVLILIIPVQILNDSLCCSNKYNWCLCRFI